MRAALVIATRQMADLVGGGLPLTRSLNIVRLGTADRRLRETLLGVQREIEGGAALSDALSARGTVFSPVYVGLVRAGESTGSLEMSFDEIARHLEAEEDFRRKTRNALVYPALVLTLAAGICLFLTVFVIPRFQVLFEDLGQRLPLPTRLLLGSSLVVRERGPLLAAAGGATALIVSVLAPRGIERLKKSAAANVPSWPLVRLWVLPRLAERWAGVMASLLRGGYPVSDALRLTRASLASHPLAPLLRPLETAIENGLSLSQAIRGIDLFPLIVSELIAAGEESGTLDDAMGRIARSLARDGETSLKLTMSLLEPALIFLMAGVVGFVAIAMLLPIFEMSGGVR